MKNCEPKCQSEDQEILGKKPNPIYVLSSPYTIYGCLKCGRIIENRPIYEAEDRWGGGGPNETSEVDIDFVLKEYEGFYFENFRELLYLRSKFGYEDSKTDLKKFLKDKVDLDKLDLEEREKFERHPLEITSPAWDEYYARQYQEWFDRVLGKCKSVLPQHNVITAEEIEEVERNLGTKLGKDFKEISAQFAYYDFSVHPFHRFEGVEADSITYWTLKDRKELGLGERYIEIGRDEKRILLLEIDLYPHPERSTSIHIVKLKEIKRFIAKEELRLKYRRFGKFLDFLENAADHEIWEREKEEKNRQLCAR